MTMTASGSQAQEGRRTTRLYYVDWLRVLAVLLLIPFHSALIFGSGVNDHWIKDTPTALSGLFAHFTHQWHMPLLFLLAGVSTRFALSFRTAAQYRAERCKRLLAPLLLIFLFFPLQVYYYLVAYAGFRGSFLEAYPIPFVHVDQFGLASVWGHLWFLVYLFVFSMICLPLFSYLGGEKGRALIDRLAALSEKAGAIFLLAAPLSIGEMALRAGCGNIRNLYADWANFSFYLILFIYGYVLAADPRFGQAIGRHCWVALGLGVVTFLIGLSWVMGGNPTEYVAHSSLSLGWFLYVALRGFNSWLWLIAILGLGQKYLDFSNNALRYLSEASMPVYILHMPLNVVVGFYVVQWKIDLFSKFLLITLGTFVLSFLFYELVKRTNFTRFLFGMKTDKESAPSLKRQTT